MLRRIFLDLLSSERLTDLAVVFNCSLELSKHRNHRRVGKALFPFQGYPAYLSLQLKSSTLISGLGLAREFQRPQRLSIGRRLTGPTPLIKTKAQAIMSPGVSHPCESERCVDAALHHFTANRFFARSVINTTPPFSPSNGQVVDPAWGLRLGPCKSTVSKNPGTAVSERSAITLLIAVDE